MPRSLPQLSCAVVLCLLSGCMTTALERNGDVLAPQAGTHGLIFVADGAGDFRYSSAAVRRAVGELGWPLRVETFAWSHGYWRVFVDQFDKAHARREGLRLARMIAVHRQLSPECPIYLVGHSAGSAVILSAAEQAPQGSIESIALLAPSVCADYDLRPALRTVTKELHVFYSPWDCWFLRGSAMVDSLFNGRFSPAAGYASFRPRVATPADAACYVKLRLYPWEPHLAWTGHDGGHYGSYQQTYLRRIVLPHLTSQFIENESARR